MQMPLEFGSVRTVTVAVDLGAWAWAGAGEAHV
jgi:hypothetical protein